MYAQDSFFDLSALGQVGLACLSGVLSLATLWALHRLARGRSIWVRLVCAVVAFWAFVWLSPQVYYMYYRLLIPDLPLQSVIKWPVGPWRLLELVTFQWRSNLSAHSQGVLGWALLAVAIFSRQRGPRPKNRAKS